VTGDGGDEALAGYELRHRAFLLAERLPIPGALRHAFSRSALEFPITPSEGGWLHRVRKSASVAFAPAERRHMALLHLFTPTERHRYLYGGAMRSSLGSRDYLAELYRQTYRGAAELSGIDRELWFSYRIHLPEQLLVKVDRASMAHSLEMRSP